MVSKPSSPTNVPVVDSLPLLYKRLAVVNALIRDLERYDRIEPVTAANTTIAKRRKVA